MTAEQPVEFTNDRVRISVTATLFWWATRQTLRLIRAKAGSPAVLTLTALLAAEWWLTTVSWWLVYVLAVVVASSAGFWAMNFRQSYDQQVRARARGTIRSLTVYRWRWSKALKHCHVITDRTQAPLLLRCGSTQHFDRLRLRLQPGQHFDDYAEASDRLAQTFGSNACRVRRIPTKPQHLEMLFLAKDPLADPVTPFSPEAEPLPGDGLKIARQEDGNPWRLRLIGRHLLLVGATGAGKSSVVWGIIYGLIPAIQARLVKLWVIDPKGGMELAPGKHLYDKFAYGSSPAAFSNILNQAVAEMGRRQARLMADEKRSHTPTAAAPLIVLIIDEMAALTSWATDRATKTQIHKHLALLLSQGRAAGIVVVGAVQDPRKDILPMRDLFPTRIALRLSEASQVAMVLGPGARERGARCDEIPDTLQGVGYVCVEGLAETLRIRFAHVTDMMIAATAPKKQRLPQLEAGEVDPETAAEPRVPAGLEDDGTYEWPQLPKPSEEKWGLA